MWELAVLSQITDGPVLSAVAWATIIPAIISAIGMFKGGGSGSSTGVTTETMDPNLAALLGTQRNRMELQNPLYEAVTRLAMGLMPTTYQSGNTSLNAIKRTTPDPAGDRTTSGPNNEPRFPFLPSSYGSVGGRTYDPSGEGGAYNEWTPEGLRRRGGRGR